MKPRDKSTASAKLLAPAPAPARSLARICFPWAVLALGLLYVGFVLMPPSANLADFDYEGFGAIPVLHNGRVKPLDTMARSYLTLLTHKQTFHEEVPTGEKDENGKPIMKLVRQPAIRWLLDVMVAMPPWSDEKVFSGPAAKHKVFRIENDEVLQLVGLEQRPGLRYSVDEIRPKVGALFAQAARADKIDPKKRTLKEVKVLELAKDFRLFQQLATWELPHGIPMRGRKVDDWKPLSVALEQGKEFLQQDRGSLLLVKVLLAYDRHEPLPFNQELKELQAYLNREFPAEAASVGFELNFNRFQPFHQASVLYIFALLLACSSWLVAGFSLEGWSRPVNLSALLLAALGFAVHTYALYARMHILGRPPVINLYSSAVFIGWCCLGVCMLIELVFRNGISLVVGLVSASVTAGVIGHYLSLDGDTLEMLQAVLDTNLWLATHVTIVTFGYSATFVAGFLGLGYVGFGVFSRIMDRAGAAMVFSAMSKMIYGVVCFATLLSFTGTVLGGIWADQSWGRFWGWDPKENGALLIVIWNALILHARWSGMVKQRGIALLAIGGNIVTAWSWFGTNMLGVGLHSYGFMSAAVAWIIVWVVFNLSMIGLGMVPLEFWGNLFQPKPPSPPPTDGGDLPVPILKSAPHTAITTSS